MRKGIGVIVPIVKQFIDDEEGASLVEYVLLVALIGVVVIGAMRYLGGVAANSLNNTAGNITNSN
jgi:Flp pilus assembly pilin Flp